MGHETGTMTLQGKNTEGGDAVSGKRAKQARQRAATGQDTPGTVDQGRPLPAGVNLQVVTDPEPLWMIDSAADKLITDHNAPAAMVEYRDQLRHDLDVLFEGDPRPVPGVFAIVATNDAMDGMYGAATLEPFLGDDLVGQDREAARNVAILHRILGSLFVVPDARYNGLANTLLDSASLAVVQDQGRYVEGFVDDRDGSVGFYRRAGAYVGGHNEPLPPRPPINLKTTHYPGKNGNWFWVDGWERHHEMMLCSRCQKPLDFHPEDGGMLHCPRCQGPKTAAMHGVGP